MAITYDDPQTGGSRDFRRRQNYNEMDNGRGGSPLRNQELAKNVVSLTNTPQPDYPRYSNSGGGGGGTGNAYVSSFNLDGFNSQLDSLLEQIKKLRSEQETQARQQYEALLNQSGDQLYSDNARADMDRRRAIRLHDERRPGNSGGAIGDYDRINANYFNNLNTNRQNARAREAGYSSNLQDALQNATSNYVTNYRNFVLEPAQQWANQVLSAGDPEAYQKIIDRLSQVR